MFEHVIMNLAPGPQPQGLPVGSPPLVPSDGALMSDLARTIEMIHGPTDSAWEITTDLPTEDTQGVILLQVPAGTPPSLVEQLHELIETSAEGILGE